MKTRETLSILKHNILEGQCNEAATQKNDNDRLLFETKRQEANLVAIEKEKYNLKF
jgi:hypothetical protein